MAGVARAVRAPCTARVAGTRVAGAEKSASKLAPGCASGTAAAPLRHSAPPPALLKTHARRAGEAPEVSAAGGLACPFTKLAASDALDKLAMRSHARRVPTEHSRDWEFAVGGGGAGASHVCESGHVPCLLSVARHVSMSCALADRNRYRQLLLS